MLQLWSAALLLWSTLIKLISGADLSNNVALFLSAHRILVLYFRMVPHRITIVVCTPLSTMEEPSLLGQAPTQTWTIIWYRSHIKHIKRSVSKFYHCIWLSSQCY